MTQDEIIEMAQECNLIGMRPHLDGIYSEALVAFANLVAAKEREALAKTQEPVHNVQSNGRHSPLLTHMMNKQATPPQRTEPKIGCVNHDCEKCKAQTEQEPVAWLDGPHLVVRSDMRERLNYKGPWVDLGRAIPDKWTPLLYTTPPQRTWVGSGDLEDSNAYFTQPQRTWVGLTNNELQPIADEYRILFGGWVEDFARAIEAKLKEKNT